MQFSLFCSIEPKMKATPFDAIKRPNVEVKQTPWIQYLAILSGK